MEIAFKASLVYLSSKMADVSIFPKSSVANAWLPSPSLKIVPLLLLMCFCSGWLWAQQPLPKPRRSPVGLATFKKGGFYAKITYGRPYMKYEKSYPFGYNVPWGKIWRTGDDDATELTINKPISINGQSLGAGTYAIFSIPDEEEWTIIFNSGLGQWGLYNYDPAKDVLRMKIKPYKIPGQMREFTIFMQESNSGFDIFLLWDKTSIRVPITITDA